MLISAGDNTNFRERVLFRMCKRFVFFISTIAIISIARDTFASSDLYYVVQDGDTFSKILYSLNLAPITNAEQSSDRECHNDRVDFVRPGDKIHFQIAIEPSLSQYVNVSESGEISIARDWIKGKKPRDFLPRDFLPSDKQVASVCMLTKGSPLLVTAVEVPESVTPPEIVRSPAPLIVTPPPVDRSYVWFSMLGSYANLNGMTSAGGDSQLLSHLQPGFRFQWRKQVRPLIELEFSTENRSLSWQVPAGKTIEGRGTLSESFLYASIFKKANWRIGPLVGYRNEPLITRLSDSTVRVETSSLAVCGLIIETEIPLGDRYILSGQSSFRYMFSAQQSDGIASNGYGVKADIQLRRVLTQQLELSLGLSYSVQEYSSSHGKHSFKEMASGLGIVYQLENGFRAGVVQ